MPQQANQPLPPGYVLNGYRIEKPLSSGGFSIVYLARDEAGTQFAIKEYLPSMLPLRPDGVEIRLTDEATQTVFRHGLKCFFEEGRALALIQHPNVVRVENFFRANETCYMVMGYVRGRTLQFHIQKNQAELTEVFIRRTFLSLLNGLREVHACKLLHLDIKPANIHLREDATPVLIDFGASRRMLGAEDPLLRPIFTPGLAAPEVHCDRAKLGPWSDIYSVGATLYACMFMRPPQPAPERMAGDRLVPAAKAGAGKYSAGLLELVDWCLRLDCLQRPQSVLALQKALLGPGHEATRVPEDPKAMLRWIMGV